MDSQAIDLVILPNPHGSDPLDDDPEYLVPLKRAADILTECLERLPPETVRSIQVDEAGKLSSFSTDPREDSTIGTEYFPLEDYQLPPEIAKQTVLRSELTEIGRLTSGVDLISYPSSLCGSRGRKVKGQDCYVFKYNSKSPLGAWAEIQMLARLPPHPNLVLLDRLVLDELSKSKVVGFTMRYVPNETLHSSKSWPSFRLRWLRELMQVVDDLNLKYGIIHQDIAARNLIVDPESDSIVLFDFNYAYRVGVSGNDVLSTEGEWKERDDVKGVLLFLYTLITQDPALGLEYQVHLVNEEDFFDPAKWIKHPDVELDAPVADFYFELMAWARRRRAEKQLTHYTQAPEHVDWPDVPVEEKRTMNLSFSVAHRRELGLPYISWERPASSRVDPARRLLATGRYADEEAAAQKGSRRGSPGEEAQASRQRSGRSGPRGCRWPTLQVGGRR
ncbi:hypothetical protein NEMBOFW57_004016 [Staphylotrichum longicolle]|uniref:EKC/KEOPS complex subunit BUD32 n=1 Tax=Staphylotrichum longicolle TaxID=669026 RepID=A0AAD4I580_9PEZI|nr:hypothetical protein NEMBOFW57_004016 [Staphylotrichum longicolle]